MLPYFVLDSSEMQYDRIVAEGCTLWLYRTLNVVNKLYTQHFVESFFMFRYFKIKRFCRYYHYHAITIPYLGIYEFILFIF